MINAMMGVIGMEKATTKVFSNGLNGAHKIQ
jgi:hypothetical protein